MTASIVGTLPLWGAFYAFSRDPKAYLPGLRMYPQPFYRDQEFWENLGFNSFFGFPGLLIAATILAGTRWPQAFLRGLVIAPIHAAFAFALGVLTYRVGSGSYIALALVLVYFGFSWLWAYVALRILERFAGRDGPRNHR